MSQPCLSIFETVPYSLRETIWRLEPILARYDYTFSGVVRGMERDLDGAIYYLIDTITCNTFTEGMDRVDTIGWLGVAYECHYQGFDVCVGIFQDEQGTTLTIEESPILRYRREEDESRYKQWLGCLLQIMSVLNLQMSMFGKNYPKKALRIEDTIELLAKESLPLYDNPIHMVARKELFRPKLKKKLEDSAYLVVETTEGFSIATWMKW